MLAHFTGEFPKETEKQGQAYEYVTNRVVKQVIRTIIAPNQHQPQVWMVLPTNGHFLRKDDTTIQVMNNPIVLLRFYTPISYHSIYGNQYHITAMNGKVVMCWYLSSSIQ
jgi:hypothetical protein